MPDLYSETFSSRAYHSVGRRLVQLAPVSLLERLFPETLCLCYHMVSDVPVPHVKHYKFLTTREFERDLDYLESRFKYVSYEQIFERRLQSRQAPVTSVCLTFDDGFAECASVVRPILLRRGATCIFFVVTDLIDNRAVFFETRVSLCVDAIRQRPVDEIEAAFRQLGLQDNHSGIGDLRAKAVPRQMLRDWMQFEEPLRMMLIRLLTIDHDDIGLIDQLCRRLGVDPEKYVEQQKPYLSREQILQLSSDGFTIGAHSCSHQPLQNLSPERAADEIVASCRVICELTGQASVPFAFPYFGGGLDREWLARLRERYPFIGLYFDTQGLRRDSPTIVQRVFGERIEETGSIDRLLRRAWLRKIL